MDDNYRKYGNSRAAHLVEIEDPHKCFVCGAFVPDGAIKCPKCQFPQNGDETSQRRFLGELRAEKKYKSLSAYRVGNAFHLLLVLPLHFFWAAYSHWTAGALLQAEIALLFGITFLLIWFFGRRSPYRALSLSLGLYTTFTLPSVISDPWVIFAPNPTFLLPHISLLIGMVNFKYWEEMDTDLKGKNTG